MSLVTKWLLTSVGGGVLLAVVVLLALPLGPFGSSTHQAPSSLWCFGPSSPVCTWSLVQASVLRRNIGTNGRRFKMLPSQWELASHGPSIPVSFSSSCGSGPGAAPDWRPLARSRILRYRLLPRSSKIASAAS